MLLQTFQIIDGILDKHIDQLIIFSQKDPVIVKHTNDPKRFKDREAFDSWRDKDKQIFVLTNNNHDLLGLVWFSKKYIFSPTYKDYGITFAIRIYPPVRGKGLSKEFAKKAIEMLKDTKFYKSAENKGIWLATKHSNEAARKVYGNLGFVEVASTNGRIVMVLPLHEGI